MINIFSVPVGGKRAQSHQPSKLQNTTAKKSKQYKKCYAWSITNHICFLEKKCSGDGETSFFVYCKICAAFREKMHQSCLLGFKGFSGNIEGFKPEYFTRHVEEEGHKHFHENCKCCSVGANGRLYERDHSRNACPA